MKRITILEVGDILYNPTYNGFHEIRQIGENTAVLSGCCSYLNDARTTICNKLVKIKYLTKLKPVHKIHKFMERCESVGTWVVTSKREDKTHLFYKDDCIIGFW